MAVKSDSRKTRLKSKLSVSAQVSNKASDSAAQKNAGRGRPRSEGKGQVVSCRLPAEELHAFDALCTQLGAKSRSDGVRSVVRMASGFLEFSREDSARLEEIRYELGKIGTNVNQIALAANRGRAPMVKAQWASVDELRRSLPMVAKALSQIIAERRRQGVALFRKFAEAQEGVRHG
ncbi:plasmid mobilization relaxosome protein MobC [Gemmobacter aquatilis]|uniref:plasmid mobilization relaxosome protein MobC n=1 Tax=Gemmobacter aquatilis TaxID=933059 RepID=UPI001FE10386|nr:plasmid mobilization relaxosome protein MobC [Gemmobacter aquatilis]